MPDRTTEAPDDAIDGGAPTPAEAPDDAIDGSAITDAELEALRSHAERSRPAFLAELERLVNLDCGSYSPAGVDEAGRRIAEALAALGARVETHADPDGRLGSTVLATFAGRPGAGPSVLRIGHLDTVFPDGTAAERPFRIEGGRAYGPGVTDMKAGLLAGVHAIAALRALAGGDPAARLPFERLTFLANPDEEIGSPTSTPHVRRAAVEADAVLVLECARANGDIVSARKGTVDLRLTVHGRAAHAGIEPEKGRNAIVEAARLVRALHDLNGRRPGVTVNVGTIRGGTRPNVVPERAELEVDVRAVARAELEATEAAIDALADQPELPDVRIERTELGRHWPMEKGPATARLVEHAVGLAARLGFGLRDASTGGASDANTTAGLGVPTLDGLGPVGGDDHAPSEYLEVDSIVPRTALLAGLLLAIARDPWFAQRRSEPPA